MNEDKLLCQTRRGEWPEMISYVTDPDNAETCFLHSQGVEVDFYGVKIMISKIHKDRSLMI